jgi:hypothetical protein
MAAHLANSHDRFTANIGHAASTDAPPALRRKPGRRAA